MDLETNSIFNDLDNLNQEDAAFRKYCTKLTHGM